MASSQEPDGKNSLIGEFLLALARAPEAVQESIVLFGLKQMTPYASTLIDAYPMLSHMKAIIDRQGGKGDSGMDH